MPPLFGHIHWSCNQPGTTLFMPVADLSLVLISLILALVDGDGGRYVRGQGGGMNIIDDRLGGRSAGTEAWIASGLIDPGKACMLTISSWVSLPASRPRRSPTAATICLRRGPCRDVSAARSRCGNGAET
jgi:hypothetical protein